MTNVTESARPHVCPPERVLQDESEICREDRRKIFLDVRTRAISPFRCVVVQTYLQNNSRRRRFPSPPSGKKGKIMNQTEHYKLSQWEKADRIMMDDFNRDNANIDTALAASAAALAAETAARTADVAVLTAKSPFVKLREIVTTQSAAQVNLDLSDINFADWQVLWLDVAPLGSWVGFLRPNGRTDAVYCQLGTTASGSTSSSGLAAYYNDKKYRTLFFPGKNEEKKVSCITVGESDGGIFYRGVCSALPFSQLKTFLLVPVESYYSLNVGTKITIWGVR